MYVTDDSQGKWVISGNGIPDHETGTFPSNRSPNEILESEYTYAVPQEPTVADSPTCLPPGPIGVATNGVVFFNPWTSKGKNAIEQETFDLCDGHPNGKGVYHYHKMPSSCLFTVSLFRISFPFLISYIFIFLVFHHVFPWWVIFYSI